MGKKRKAPSGEKKPRERKDDSKLAITTFEDVADEQDEFHLNRDKVLLDEGPAAKRLRKWKEQDEFLEPSDEEVLGYSSGEDDNDDDMEAASDDGAELKDPRHEKSAQEEEDDAAGWGPSKKDYYNADAIETEQDALDEEAEARRIQQKGLAAMTEADFGFDEDEWLAEGQGGEESGNVVTEVLPQLQITDDMTEKEKLKILKTRYPEFEFISKEFLRLQPLHDELAAAANAAERLVKARAAKSAASSISTPPTPMAVTKYRACAAYLAAMAMCFAILGSTAKEDGSPAIAMDPAELHEHAVMESLLKCQGLWARVESLPVADPMVEPINGDELSVIDEDNSISDTHFNKARSQKKKEKKEGRKTKKEIAAEEAQATAEARRAEKLRRTEEELTTLSSLTDPSALRKAARKQKKEQPMLNLLNADDSDFGEETSFTAHELAEKAKKKKSLRFYTSQIVQKAIKRDAAGKDQGGDADIPHRERLRDRQARLQAEAEKRGQGLAKKAPGVTLGEGGESDDDNEGPAKPLATDGDDDYYDMIAARGTAKKEAKQELADAYRLAAKEGGSVVPQEVIGADGKRKITYMIQKNKGLTPHRSKTVRNPRVKKKLKYEKKKKQLKSMKAVYSGGEAKGGYGGELTGIKKGLVRSTKL